jgi:hypothetical protein
MSKIQFNKKLNISRVVRNVVRTVLSLYVGGTILSEVGSVVTGTCSPFYKGLSLIGWTVSTGNASHTGCDGNTSTITSTNGSGILSVIGIIAIASIVLEFVNFNF